MPRNVLSSVQPFLASAATAASFAPVPLLPVAINLISQIITCCENVSVNREAVQDLRLKCEDLIRIMKRVDSDTENDSVREHVLLLLAVLHRVQDDLERWARYSTLKSFFLQHQVKTEISQISPEIDRYVKCFEIASQNDIRATVHRIEERVEVVTTSRQARVHFAESMTGSINLGTSEHEGEAVFEQSDVLREKLFQQIIKKVRKITIPQNLFNIRVDSNIPLPKGVEIRAGKVERTGTQPIYGSLDIDVWKGRYKRNVECTLKIIRVSKFNERQRMRLTREVQIWRHIYAIDKGKYIVPFYGVCFIDTSIPYLVSPYYKNGDALTYVRINPDVNRMEMIRRIAEGLKLLHGQKPPIVHGELKAAKIMISDDGYPLIADFGLSKMIENALEAPFTQSNVITEQHRWFAPEVYSTVYKVSTASDVFSYAMTVLEIMTGAVPFAELRGARAGDVSKKVQDGERPERPTTQEIVERGLDDIAWGILTRCWAQRPENRPSIEDVLRELPGASPRHS